MFRFFPPPSSGAHIVIRAYGTGTWLTSNAAEALILELIVGYVVFLDELPYLSFRPVPDRIDFYYIVAHVLFNGR